ncbi:hypothetical protein HMPREF1979_03063 [Actinomyces johnsonii F0542]|uniref:Uncharacterized protein n=1 Tax=Actinomyces johnsonii F0542 TaxID=1321818 RepID=U1RT93_9ACTO|nr:hypothetical protein HMPREF1979_03063 [Actinomyces johnsonii F0542]
MALSLPQGGGRSELTAGVIQGAGWFVSRKEAQTRRRGEM